MNVNQNYGVLRVMGVHHHVHQAAHEKRVNPHPSAITLMDQDGYQSDWLAEERFVHVISHRETTIGRALDNEVILMDPTVSRKHARLVLDNRGWCIYNLTKQNTVLVNGHSVPSGGCLSLLPQDFLQIGNTILQLVAPRHGTADNISPSPSVDQLATVWPFLSDHVSATNGHTLHKGNTEEFVSQDADSAVAASLSALPDAELRMQTWHDERESLSGNVVTMELAVPRRLGLRVRWMTLLVGLVVLTVGVIGTFVLNSLGEFAVLVQSSPSGLLVGLTIPLIPAISINLLVNFIDRFKREPWFLRLAAFLWGAIIAIPPAVFVEQFIDGFISNWWGVYPNIALHSFLQGLDAGITEETVKGLGLLLLFVVLRDQFDNVTDGIVYGALIGAGFAMVENVVNFVNPRDLLGLIVGRIVLGWFCHSTFTVCFGAALGYIRHTRVRWQQIVIPLLGYLLAVGLHTGFDFVNAFVRNFSFTHSHTTTVTTLMLVAVVSDYIPPFIAQVVILSVLIKALAHEEAIIREFLVSEVSAGIVTVDEYALLQHSFARTKNERKILWQQGIKQWLRVKSLYQTEIGLAFRKWHVSMGDKPKFTHMHSEDAYRQRILLLRQQVVAAQKIKNLVDG
jgi:RsiW-degrading membrane proteinase PrsW (M82 family)/pSer/pThr/pTyr-binding forkhead associated (FHA) protein